VYVEPHAALYLDDKVLDAQVDSAGNPHFTLGLQRPSEVLQTPWLGWRRRTWRPCPGAIPRSAPPPSP
jgi:hypothetical protein